MRRLLIPLALVVSAGVLAASCSGGSSYGSSPPTAATSAVASPRIANDVNIENSVKLGPVLTDASGYTLYEFDHDVAGSGTSACTGSCATNWPPAITKANPPTRAAALTGTLALLNRADGTRQLTYNGHPLYRFAGDPAPGDTNGDGVGGVWHAARAQAAQASPSPTAAGGYTNY